MSIKTGYRMWAKASDTQTFVMSEDEAGNRYNSDPATWEGYTLTPVRIVKTKYMWYFIDDTKENGEGLLYTIRRLFEQTPYISIVDNYYADKENDYWRSWESAVESGKSLLVGDSMSTKQYLSRCTSSSSDWQVLAQEWAKMNPTKRLIITTYTNFTHSNTFVWHVYQRGEYVEMRLPHHDSGGEKSFISRLDKPNRKLLVDVD